MATSRIRLGHFELRSVLGSGGMADVWRGVDLLHGVPVAVKVMTADKARGARFRSMFDNEVRAMAGLEHPCIAHVHDYGQIDMDASRGSDGRLVEGSSWLAMELASSGTLARIERPLPWPRVRAILRALLDALAHAHARGVVHRDLKPANILFCGPGDLRPGLKLADFGLAHPVEAASGSRRISGTPQFMSPEQFRGAWRDYGPWTDLYAVGVLAQELATGSLPFRATDLAGWRQAHLEQAPWPIAASVPVPPGFAEWVGRLLEKRPSKRFRRAADAAWALEQLDDSDLTTSLDEEPVTLVPTSVTHSHTLAELIADEPMPLDEMSIDTRGGPPIPADWRRREERPPPQLLGAGSGLHALRPAPFVGRETQRDAIWAALHDVKDSGTPRLIEVAGLGGVGKRRLVRWMCERAHELGAATVLRATHNAIPAPMDGIGGLLARMFRCQGLARPTILDRTRTGLKSLGMLDPDDWEGLADVVAATSGDSEVTWFRSPSQRYSLVQRVLAARSRVRPLIVWIDDAQWGADTLACVQAILAGSGPILVLLTERDDAKDAHPLALDALARLSARPGVEKLTLGRMTDTEQRDLVHRVLGLEPTLASQVLARAGGTPLFAVQLVDDWLARGQLVPTRTGLALAEGAPIELPDGLHDLFVERLTRVLGDDAGAWRALEVAAVLGRETSEREWRMACWRIGHVVHPETLTRLVDAGLLSQPAEGDAWRFEHSLLRESLVRRAAEGRRLAEAHLACASALEELYSPDVRGSRHRIGRHYVAAESWHEALEPLLAAARSCRSNSEFPQVLELLDLLDDAFDQAETPPSDPARGDARMLRAMALRYVGRFEEARTLALALDAQAVDHDWPIVHARSVELLANLARIRRDLPEALTGMQHALELFRALGHERGVGTSLLGLGAVHWQMGDLESARQVFEDSLAHHKASGNTGGLADTYNGLAELARTVGELDLAESLYKMALTLHQKTRSGIAMVVRLNICLVRIARGRYLEAESDLLRCLDSFERQGRSTYQGAVHILLLPGCADRGDWAAWDRHHQRGLERITASGTIEKDIAWPAFLAAEIAARQGQRRRAWEALVIARSQWKALGDAENAARASAAMKKLGA